jgi:hypothetical protein
MDHHACNFTDGVHLNGFTRSCSVALSPHWDTQPSVMMEHAFTDTGMRNIPHNGMIVAAYLIAASLHPSSHEGASSMLIPAICALHRSLQLTRPYCSVAYMAPAHCPTMPCAVSIAQPFQTDSAQLSCKLAFCLRVIVLQSPTIQWPTPLSCCHCLPDFSMLHLY